MFRSLAFVWWRKFRTLLSYLPKLDRIVHSLKCGFEFVACATFGYVYSQLKQLWSLTMHVCVKWACERLSRHSERCYPSLRLGETPTIRDTYWK